MFILHATSAAPAADAGQRDSKVSNAVKTGAVGAAIGGAVGGGKGAVAGAAIGAAAGAKTVPVKK